MKRAVVRTRRASLDLVADGAGLIVLAVVGILFGVLAIEHPPVDAFIFWSAGHADSPYGTTWGPGVLYVYPPPLAQLLGVLPWAIFVVLWMPLLFLAFWAATRQWSLPVFVVSVTCATVIGFGFVLANPAALTFVGNPQVLIAAVCVLGFRWPALWAIPILTKLSPGIGLVWFAVRGEWRNLGMATATTAAIVAGSIVTGPQDWADFIRFAIANAGTAPPVPVLGVPLLVRLPMAIALIVWGARTNRRWTVPIAVGWSALALYEWSAVTIWMAALPLLTDRRSRAASVGGRTAQESWIPI